MEIKFSNRSVRLDTCLIGGRRSARCNVLIPSSYRRGSSAASQHANGPGSSRADPEPFGQRYF
ncbi:hypothetical protein EYF80_046333 [Liparis tanakae]|uniref:Uncharacterized protein n=1 Tax=Liparis tanakae TaxID=230148 RepID=A0A4Z2FRC8_9TELE|nr:hypothetical protein EYF80_046333 [Liparis tanakae]